MFPTWLTFLLTLVLGVTGLAFGTELLLRGTTRAVRNRLKLLYQKQGGLVSFFGAFVLFIASKRLLRDLDPTTAPFDLGWVQTILISAMRLLVFHGLTKYFLKYYWPVLDHYLAKRFNDHFNLLTPWQKVCISFSAFALFFYGFIQLTH